MNVRAITSLLPLLGISFLWVAMPLPVWGQPASERYETVLLGGSIHRGDGSEPFIGHVAIRDGKIAAIIPDAAPKGEMEIDCSGMVISPGFIDLHNHSDDPILKRDTRANANYLLQGCTTIVTGNCGGGHVDVKKYLAAVDRDGAGTNVAHLLPQGSLRRQVMGSSRRAATDEEISKMLQLAEAAMADGAFGMSTGLIYVPGTFTPTEELIQIARVVSRHGGIYASHIRDEGSGLLESIEEAIKIGREADLPVHISHLKASGKANWGSLRLAMARIEEEREKGRMVTADQYPYAASSTSLEATLFPAWAREGSRSDIRRRLLDQETGAKIRDEVAAKLARSSRIQLVSCSYNPELIGRSLDEAAALEGIETIELVMRVQQHGGASVVNFGISEDDMRLAMPVSWVATASDGGAKVPTASQPHPRSFGTFPRKIGYYALRQDVMSLAAAIRSCSGLPAEILGLADRGLIEPGMVADIAIFDPAELLDRATFDAPYLPPTGMKYVLVNGEAALFDGQLTGVLAGRSLRKQAVSEDIAASSD
jgi:N-acyl-D-amino-acid deacylase